MKKKLVIINWLTKIRLEKTLRILLDAILVNLVVSVKNRNDYRIHICSIWF